MEMNHVCGTSAFVKVIHVLSDHHDFESLFKIGESFVSGVGLRICRLSSSLVVKLEDDMRLSAPRFGCCHIFKSIVSPQSAAAAEGCDSGGGTDARTSENKNLAMIDRRLRHCSAD